MFEVLGNVFSTYIIPIMMLYAAKFLILREVLDLGKANRLFIIAVLSFALCQFFLSPSRNHPGYFIVYYLIELATILPVPMVSFYYDLGRNNEGTNWSIVLRLLFELFILAPFWMLVCIFIVFSLGLVVI